MVEVALDIDLQTPPVEDAKEDELLQSVEAEQALLGTALSNADIIDKVTPFIRPEHFFVEFHGRLWASIVEMHREGALADPVTLKPRYMADPDIEVLGGYEYITELVYQAASPTVAINYARLLNEMRLRRLGGSLFEESKKSILDPNGEAASTILTRLAEDASALAIQGATKSPFSNPYDMGLDLLSEEQAVQVPTGWRSVDEMVMFDREAITLLAGHTSMGKSAVAVDIARRVARMGYRVDFFSLEMSKRQIAARMISAQLAEDSNPEKPRGIPYFKLLRTHALEDWQREDARKATLELPELNIDTTGDLSVSDMIARLSSDPRPLDLVIVDYVNIVSDSDMDSKLRTDQKIGKVAARLRNLAKTRNCAVLLLCQLNRNSVSRDQKAPELSDLKDSSTLEQAADAVLFCHRPEYFLEREIDRAKAANEQPDPEVVERLKACRRHLYIICAKQRNGPTGQVRLRGHIYFNYITE